VENDAIAILEDLVVWCMEMEVVATLTAKI
jgi:hypothetical protein